MARKEFIIDERGYALMGDERDIMVHAKHYYDVVKWCKENGITATLGSPTAAAAFNQTLWRVPDETERLIFMLRWS